MKELQLLKRSLKPVEMMHDLELAALPLGEYFVWDIEAYINYAFVGFKHLRSGKCIGFEYSERCPDFDRNKLLWMIFRFVFVDFNGDGFDRFILALILNGATNEEIKEACNVIIGEDVRKWDIAKRLNVKPIGMNHIDLMEVAPLRASLKMYAARIHSKRLQDLPFEHTKRLSFDEMDIVNNYCFNDLDLTEDLLTELWKHIEIRIQMSEKYGIDLRSKSDAQIAEAVVKHEIYKLTGAYPQKPASLPSVLRYTPPESLSYELPQLKALLRDMEAAEFTLGHMGPLAPKTIEGRKISIGKCVFTVGMGGLHSTEKEAFHLRLDDEEISDNDVESFYPRLILNQKLFPAHIGEIFLEIYEKIVTTRINAKKDRNKTVADMLKIVINGLFGKLGDLYSSVVSPQLMLQVTISGQLLLLKLIEMLELNGIEVISANTDGVVSKYRKANRNKVRAIISDWEKMFALKTEETQYKFLASRDVNNYIAAKLKFDKEAKVYTDEIEEIKLKGVYALVGSALNSPLSKNPEYYICSEAIQQFLANGTPIEKTVKSCKDVTKFVFIRNAAGGAHKDGVYLGKALRWYMPTDKNSCLRYVKNNNKVAQSEGAAPLMDLPEELPGDLDFDFYINRAVEMLYDVGYYRKAKTASLF